MKFNYYGFKAIYVHEMNRFIRTIGQSLLSPVISTSLYFVVFGSVIGNYIQKIDGSVMRGTMGHSIEFHSNSLKFTPTPSQPPNPTRSVSISLEQ